MPYSYWGTAADGQIIAAGCWIATARDPHSVVPVVNAAQVICDRQEGRCTEALASLHSALDANYRKSFGSGQHALLVAEITEYPVVEWSPTAIRALAEPRAADIEIRISPAEEVVIRVATETSARGAVGADPTPQVWKLGECNR
jgi:hypothetical protein